MIKTSQSISYHFQRLRLLTNANDLTRFYRIRRNIHHATVYNNMLMTHQLTGSRTGRSNAQTINDIIQTTFQILQKDLTGNTTGPSSFLEHVTELLFQNSVGIFSFLLFCQHDTILGSFSSSVVSMLSGRIILLRQNLVRSENSVTETTSNL